MKIFWIFVLFIQFNSHFLTINGKVVSDENDDDEENDENEDDENYTIKIGWQTHTQHTVYL